MDDKVNLSGKWSMIREENFEDFLKANGVNWFVRKMATKIHPHIDLSQNGDHIKSAMHVLVFTQTSEFTIGKEFRETAQPLGGKEMTAMASWENNSVVAKYRPLANPNNDDEERVIIREITENGELLITFKFRHVVAKRWFKKV